MDELISKRKPIKGFKWIDKQGKPHSPSCMTTKHLFFALRMLWNHSAPKEMRIEPYIRYTFPNPRPIEYYQNAVRAILAELSKRKNLTDYYTKCLQIMKGNLNIYYGTKLIEEDKDE